MEATWSRSQILRLKKLLKNQTSNVVFLSYGRFPARNGLNILERIEESAFESIQLFGFESIFDIFFRKNLMGM